MKRSVAKLGNHLYALAPGLYLPLYSVYKAISDRAERDMISRYLSPGMTVIDVGANIGVYTRFFAGLVGPGGKVIAIEPDAENYRRLSAEMAGVPGVIALHAAASDETGTCTLYRSSSLNVDHQTYDSGEDRELVTVPASRIDDLVEQGERVDFIKMDIQGAEPIAMRGAQRVLSDNRDIVLLFEYWPYGIRRSGHDPGAFLDYLRSLGFKLDTIPPDREGTFLEGEDNYYNIVAKR